MKVYAASEILEDLWNYGNQGSSGVLGYGPKSPFWTQYINDQGQAYYSMILNDPTAISFAFGAASEKTSEVSFGSKGTDY